VQQTINCRICGHEAVTLARHLKAAHGVTASAYREHYPDARIRSEACEANRRAAITQSHTQNSRKGQRKMILCPTCSISHEVGLTFASKDHRCPPCRDAEAWAGKVEGQDYVVCCGCGCGYRAENLTSHVQHAHPEWVGCYPAQMVAASSAVRDKTALQGRTLPPETRTKMSANAGRWNAGLTKDTDERVAAQAEKMAGRTSWSKGLTKADHPSLRATSEKLSRWSGERRYWSNGLRADLSDVDFTPYLDETGAVDRRLMAEELGLSEPTVTKYMEAAGLRLSTKYVDARVQAGIGNGHFQRMVQRGAEKTTIRLTREQLLPYCLKDGRVAIGRAMAGLGHVYAVIRRECGRLGLPVWTHLVRQTLCLDAIAKVLGGVTYEMEWRSAKFTNPATGHRFRFDGYFPSHNLVAEFHGFQHWTFPSVYIKRDDLYFALQERDRIKENLIHSDPTLRYFLVREDEPYADPDYLRARLLDEGFLDT